MLLHTFHKRVRCQSSKNVFCHPLGHKCIFRGFPTSFPDHPQVHLGENLVRTCIVSFFLCDFFSAIKIFENLLVQMFRGVLPEDVLRVWLSPSRRRPHLSYSCSTRTVSLRWVSYRACGDNTFSLGYLDTLKHINMHLIWSCFVSE